MANLLLNIVLWVVLGGFITFCVLYSWLASPWKDHMGRHVLFFMVAFAMAFIYAIVSRYIPTSQRIDGWIVVLVIIGFMVWWRVAILIQYQLMSRRAAANVERK